MHIGMLWFDETNKPLTEKIKRAAQYYEKKYGRAPDTCLVYPNILTKDQKLEEIPGLTVRAYRAVLPGHLWIGISEEPTVQTPESEPA